MYYDGLRTLYLTLSISYLQEKSFFIEVVLAVSMLFQLPVVCLRVRSLRPS